MDEHQMRDIARQECERLFQILEDEVGRTPMRADMNLNQKDFMQTIEIARRRFREIEPIDPVTITRV